jgi:hypothetical protein
MEALASQPGGTLCAITIVTDAHNLLRFLYFSSVSCMRARNLLLTNLANFFFFVLQSTYRSCCTSLMTFSHSSLDAIYFA